MSMHLDKRYHNKKTCKDINYKHKMAINQTVSIEILKSDLIYNCMLKFKLECMKK